MYWNGQHVYVTGKPAVNVNMLLAPTPLQARYGLVGLKDNDFPKYKLFKKGADTTKPADYTPNNDDAKSSKSMLNWIIQQTGVFIGVKVSRQQQ